MEILAIIPARSGSKSIAHKNIQSLGGKPLIKFSIEHALESKEINRVIVSTDSEYYAEMAKSFGAEVPFLRPANISNDIATDYDTFSHALNWVIQNENYKPEIIVHLRPTSPFRKIQDIDSMINLLRKNQDLDSIRSVTKHKESVFKMWFIKNGILEPAIKSEIGRELYNEPRQNLEPTYIQNACIDVTRFSTVMDKHSMTGSKIGAYLLDYFGDIDDWNDFNAARKLSYGDIRDKAFCVDVDGVIASLTPNNNYALAKPLTDNISKINKLYERGNRIIVFTARGSMTKTNWRELTEQQLKNWNVKYHELKFDKPAADYYIDDRMLDLNDIVI